MLDTSTKKRIDDCRDILVGKLPDPKAQIEQITIGLIYKFMDDMDKEAIELGGKAKFFSGNYKKYSWDALFDTKVTAAEMLKLYTDAIMSMDKNPNIPQLFRDIFKNAYLPYRDPETLKLFLKTIGEFEYTHSEKLGDAFEYLLSVMGSQGDAGQFRTPRHIIDFLVAAVNPGKSDTILDPACGTAGFLISAFKHIKGQAKSHSKKGQSHSEQHSSHSELVSESKMLKQVQHDGLTPDEQKRLIQNFVGYDISPDMVRLSLVNLYLHGFSDPHIWEYDTLSSEERWNENFDVILANPPFMSPKGGIRPHKKFTISSNRSEVLFVDYIAEHLNPKGRAGIIVPEGVIFQSGTAYKDLRKMLVENYLYAVVSLPAGVFNPYSGVKTSILLMDKEFAKTSKEILFIKIDNDGFNLGAQRNAVKGGQLADAIELLNQFREGHSEQQSSHSELVSESKEMLKQVQHDYGNIAHAVLKSEIAKNGDYNLSGERYKETVLGQTEFDLYELEELFDIKRGGSPRPIEDFITEDENGINWIKIGDVEEGTKYVNSTKQKIKPEGLKKSRLVEKGDFILSNSMSYGRPYIVNITGAIHDGWLVFKQLKNNLNKDYIFNILSSQFVKNQFAQSATGGVVKNLNIELVKKVKIPLPPLSVQEEIVAEIESYQKIIDGAKMVVENYKPKIVIDPEWGMVELGDLIDSLETGVSVNSENGDIKEGEYGVLKTSAVTYGDFRHWECKKILEKELTRAKCKPKKDSIIISRMNTEQLVGASAYVDKDYENLFLPDRLWQTVVSRNDVSVRYLHQVISSPEYRKKISDLCGGTSGSMKNISKKSLLSLTVPFPNFDDQIKIVSQIEKEQELVNANKQLIEIFEQKIKDRIAKVWGE